MDAVALEAIFGTAEPPAILRPFRTGALAASLDGGNLRNVTWHGIEVLRGIAFLARDTRWGTYTAALSDLAVTEENDAFSIAYAARCEGPDGEFSYRAAILGMSDGTLEFRAEGSAAADFPTNRTGFVVLHPLRGVAGASVIVGHTDDSSETVELPMAIAPDTPATDIRTISHRPVDGVSVEVTLLGDAYEMEDQRNWTDASFKTYVRPLSRPRPYTLLAGQRIEQSVVLKVAGVPAAAVPANSAKARLFVGPATGLMPAIGIGLESAETEACLFAASPLRDLGAQVLVARCEAEEARAALFVRLETLRAALNTTLTLELIVPDIGAEAALFSAGRAARESALRVSAIVPVPRRDMKTRPTEPPAAGESPPSSIYTAARLAFPEAALGGGMLTLFTEFNRNRPDAASVDFVTHASAANVHAADDVSVLETLETLPHVMRSVAAIAPGKPYRLGPSAIALRTNPYGPSVAANPENKRITMARRDPRHFALFGAAWSLAFAEQAALHGLAEITLSHGVGDFGVLTPLGAVTPLFHLVRGLARGAGSPFYPVETGVPNVRGLAFGTPADVELWLCNIGPQVEQVELGKPFRPAFLDASSIALTSAMASILDEVAATPQVSITLGPHAVARLTAG